MKKTTPIMIGLIALMFVFSSSWAEQKVHIVQEGDTLWDISQMYLKTPWKWPMVWANNQEITNPHLIYPNDRVIISRENGKIKITIVPAQEVAESEPEVYSPQQIAKFKEKSIVVSPQFSTLIYSPTILEGSGEVIGNQDGGSIASVNDIILLSMKKDVVPEQGLTIASMVKEIKKDKAVVGYLYKIVAMAKVTDVQAGITKAELTYGNQEVEQGQVIFDDLAAIKPIALDISEPSFTTEGRILALHGGLTKASDMDIVIIDLGKSQGIQDGALLGLYKEIQVKEKKTSVRNYEGMALVLQTLDTSAMGLVVDANGPIERGFIVAQPE